MIRLMRFPSSVKRDPDIEAWMNEHSDELGVIAKCCFDVMRDCGDDVRELLHDGHPTACVGDAVFAYVNAFTAHVNVGFFDGAELDDPNGLVEGAGKFMRHVKLRPESQVDAAALRTLIDTAYTDIEGSQGGLVSAGSQPCSNLNTSGNITTTIHAHTAYTGRYAVCHRYRAVKPPRP